jgi:hypothetical protein
VAEKIQSYMNLVSGQLANEKGRERPFECFSVLPLAATNKQTTSKRDADRRI